MIIRFFFFFFHGNNQIWWLIFFALAFYLIDSVADYSAKKIFISWFLVIYIYTQCFKYFKLNLCLPLGRWTVQTRYHLLGEEKPFKIRFWRKVFFKATLSLDVVRNLTSSFLWKERVNMSSRFTFCKNVFLTLSNLWVSLLFDSRTKCHYNKFARRDKNLFLILVTKLNLIFQCFPRVVYPNTNLIECDII